MKSLKSDNVFDAIVIGSGIGGLALAAILAKRDQKRVLVLEKHFQLGGLTHEFSRGRFTWDVGLHYVGGMEPGEFNRLLFDYLTDGKLEWTRMPHVFEKFVYPGMTIEVPSSKQEYRDKLLALFPAEKTSIHRYFKDIDRIASWYRAHILLKTLPTFASSLVRLPLISRERTALLTVREYLDSRFKDNRLKGVLASQWGDYGLPPTEASFAIHALIVEHYLSGGYYPRGGASSIVRHIQPMIERTGGVLLAGHEMTELLVQNETVIGVKTRYWNGDHFESTNFYAEITFSDIGANETYRKLLKPHTALPDGIETIHRGSSAVTAYIGFRKSPKELGIQGENFWIYGSYDHDRTAGASAELLKGKPAGCSVSFPSLKNPDARAHTAEISVFNVGFDEFRPFAGSAWLHREQDYYDLKARMLTGMIDLADAHIKGFRDIVEYAELSTPLSMENFTSRDRGLMYGVPCVPGRFRLSWLSARTRLKNFFLTGSDVGSIGILGAVMGAVMAAAELDQPFGFFKIMAAVKKDARTRDSGKSPGTAAAQPRGPLSGEVVAELASRTHLGGPFHELVFTLSERVSFLPGQHMYVQVSATDWRPYTIVRLLGNTLTFIIDVTPGGPGSQFALHHPVGGRALMRKPQGTFCLSNDAREKVFIATGCGITPIIPMLASVAARHQGEKVRVLWGIRTQDQDFSSRYFSTLAERIPLDMDICVSRPEGPCRYYPGRVNQRLREIPVDYRESEFYVCGNPGMVADVCAFLRSKGANRINFEI